MKILAFLTLFLSSFAFAADLQQSPKPYEKLLYLGYDFVKGNPINDGGDPGWRDPFLLDAEEALVCFPASMGSFYRHYEIFEESKYQAKLWDRASTFDHNFFGTTVFTGSEEFEYQRSEVFSQGLISIQTEAFVTEVECILEHFDGYEYVFAPDFLDAVANLPTTTTGEWFETIEAFFEKFGTHTMYRSFLGAVWVYESQFTHENYNIAQDSGDLYVGLSASAEFFRTQGASAQYESARDTEARIMVESLSEKQRSITVGTPPPVELDFMYFWQQQVDPIPTIYELITFSSWLTPGFFPDDPDIEQKRKVMEEGYALYCNEVTHCHPVR